MVRQYKQLDAQIFFKKLWAENRIRLCFVFLLLTESQQQQTGFFLKSNQIKKRKKRRKFQSTNWATGWGTGRFPKTPARKQAGPARSPPPS